MTPAEALAFWHGRVNFEVRSATPADLKLERMRALLSRLGDPHLRCRVVHVTGTKGKGSTAAMIAAVLRAAGYRVGLFTSPHLERVEERVQVDGKPISPAELATAMTDIAAAVREMDREPHPPASFFEIGTALGFLHFARRRVEVAVVEVGLGGRFDSTNVCRPSVCVVTSVGLDHTAQLGNTLEAIAYQKAGILKRGVPAVSGVTEPGPAAVVERVAAEAGVPLWRVGREVSYQYTPATRRAGGVSPPVLPQTETSRLPVADARGSGDPPPLATFGRPVGAAPLINPEGVTDGSQGWRVAGTPGGLPPATMMRLLLAGSAGLHRPLATTDITTPRATRPGLELNLLGRHQAANAAAAVAALDLLAFPLPETAIRTGLRTVRWPARVELVATAPAVVLDTAHNLPSVDALLATLAESVPVPGRRRVVFACSADKPYPDMLARLAEFFHHLHLTRYGDNPRCVPPEALAAALARVAPQTPHTTHPTAAGAWAVARTAAGPDDLVCVTGSVFLAGELGPLVRGG